MTGLRIGIVGHGSASMDFADRLSAIDGVSIVGCTDADPSSTRPLDARTTTEAGSVPAFDDHLMLLRQATPDALVIATPDRSCYRPAMDGLQAGCHLLIISPLSTSVQEAVDIVGLARARDRKVDVGHGFRRSASMIAARRMIAGGAIGRLRLVTGYLAMLGIDEVDALLWASGKPAELVSACRSSEADGPELVSTASIRLADGVFASIASAGFSHAPPFELTFHGDGGRLRATAFSLLLEGDEGQARPVPLSEASRDVAEEFVAALREGTPLGCPAEQALDAVRLLEAITRSATIGQFVGLG